MLGYIVSEQRGATDRLIRAVAEQLGKDGVELGGAVQVNLEHDPAAKCHMDLHILSGTEVVRISQDLGALSKGCRLDPGGLERAVGLAGAALEAGAELFIVNKFGKQESDGRGFRPLIGEALGRGVPVLTAVTGASLPAFSQFAQGMEKRLPMDESEVLAWCRASLAGAAE